MDPSTSLRYIAFTITILILTMKVAADLPIRIISHNVRYATTSPFEGERPWADRKPLLLSALKYNTLYNAESFVCLQEVLHQQLVDIMSGLNDKAEEEWGYIGVGRNDGKKEGEYSPIIYRKNVWEVETWKTVWLSETPNVPGKGWDAASIRIVTVGTFVHKQSRKRLVGMSTHFDDQGQISRAESAKLILKVINDVTKPTNTSTNAETLPVFLSGDLNSTPDDEAFQILNASNSSIQDVKELATWKYGEKYTYTGFTESTAKGEIDHVLVGRKGNSWLVKGYSVLANLFEDGIYISDHRAVVGDVVLKV